MRGSQNTIIWYVYQMIIYMIYFKEIKCVYHPTLPMFAPSDLFLAYASYL